MEKETTKAWILEVATKLCERAAEQGFKLPFHFDCYDDAGHGRVCSFEMENGKVIWFSWNADVVAVASWPLRLKLESADGEWSAAWLRSNSWQLANTRQVSVIG